MRHHRFNKMAVCTSSVAALMVSFFIQSGLAQIYVYPANLYLAAGATGRVEISCAVPAYIEKSSILLIRISRKTNARPTVDQAIATAFALKRVNPGEAVVVSPASGGLPPNSATVWGSIGQKFVELILTRAGPQDAGIYFCKVFFISGVPSNPQSVNVTSHHTLTVTVD